MVSRALLYADDTVVYSTSADPERAGWYVQRHASQIEDFYKKWRIRLNTEKSAFLCFRNASGKGRRDTIRKSRRLRISIGGTVVPRQAELKYLGVNFNQLLKFNGHVAKLLLKANRIFNMLYPLIGRRSKLNVRSKLLLYSQMIRPVIAYAFPCWFSVSTTYARRLEAFERKVLRECLSIKFREENRYYSNETIYRKAGVRPLMSYLARLWCGRVTKLREHENGIIRSILDGNETDLDGEFYGSPVSLLADQDILVEDGNNRLIRFYEGRDATHHRG